MVALVDSVDAIEDSRIHEAFADENSAVRQHASDVLRRDVDAAGVDFGVDVDLKAKIVVDRRHVEDVIVVVYHGLDVPAYVGCSAISHCV